MSETGVSSEYLLAHSSEDYFTAIKPSESYLSKLGKVKDYLPTARVVASLGMAGGEDICALAAMYGDETKLIGIDISPVALELAKKATTAAGVEADFIEANATDLSLPDNSVDGFVLSAVMHEVYSYSPNGKDAFVKSVQEICRTTSRGGYIFVSDFAAPRVKNSINIQPKSKEAEHFIDYFVNNFRKFVDTESFVEVPLPVDDHAVARSDSWTGGPLVSSPAFASELLWHFKHYKKSFGDYVAGSRPEGWKEINEVYIPPNPLVLEYEPMSVDDYASTILQIHQSVKTQTGASLRCMGASLTSQRPDTLDMLDEHFSLALTGKVGSRRLLKECTNWMDLTFKKEAA